MNETTAWIKSLYGFTVAINNEGKFPDLPKANVPETAFDRLKHTLFMDRHRQRVSLLLAKD